MLLERVRGTGLPSAPPLKRLKRHGLDRRGCHGVNEQHCGLWWPVTVGRPSLPAACRPSLLHPAGMGQWPIRWDFGGLAAGMSGAAALDWVPKEAAIRLAEPRTSWCRRLRRGSTLPSSQCAYAYTYTCSNPDIIPPARRWPREASRDKPCPRHHSGHVRPKSINHHASSRCRPLSVAGQH